MSEMIGAKRQLIDLVEKIIPEHGVWTISGSITFTTLPDKTVRDEMIQTADEIGEAMKGEKVQRVERRPGFLSNSDEYTIEFANIHEVPR